MIPSPEPKAAFEAPPRRGRPPKAPDRRQEVLRTAARIFSEYGFKNATLADVGQSLGFSRPALYHYARSKHELLTECAAIAFGELLEALTSAKAEATGLKRVRFFFHRYAEIVTDDFGRCFVLTDRRELNDEQKEQVRHTQLTLGHAVEAFIGEGVADSSIRPCNAADVSRALFGAFNGIPRWRHPGSPRSLETITESLLDIFGQGLQPR